MTFERDPVHGVGLLVLAQSEGGIGQLVGLAVDIDVAAVDGLAVRPAQIGL